MQSLGLALTFVALLTAQTPLETTLIDAAVARFGEVSDGDREFLTSFCHAVLDRTEGTYTVKVSSPRPSREVLLWSLSSSSVHSLVSVQHIQFRSLDFDYLVNCENLTIPFSLEFIDCRFRDYINFERASVASLEFANCCFDKRVYLADSEFKGDCLFSTDRNAPIATDAISNDEEFSPPAPGLHEGVNLSGAKIRGDLEFMGMRIDVGIPKGSYGWALDIGGAQIGHRLEITAGIIDEIDTEASRPQPTIINGSINLQGTSCTDLLIADVEFRQPNNDNTIWSTGMKIRGDLVLEGRIKSVTPICFEEISVDGDVSLRSIPTEKYQISKLYLAGASIGRDLRILIGSVADVIDAESVRVGADCFLYGNPPETLRSDLTDLQCRRLYLPRTVGEMLSYKDETGTGKNERSRYLGLDGVKYTGVGLASSLNNCKAEKEGDLTIARREFLNAIERQTVANKSPNVESYRQLAKCLQELGREVESREVLQTLEWRQSPTYNVTWQWVAGPITGWGYEPLNVSWILVVVWFVGAMLFSLNEGKIVPTDVGRYLTDSYPRFNPLLYVFDVMSPLVEFGQDSAYTPAKNERCLIFVLHLLRILGWWLVTILVVGVTGVLKVSK